LRGNISAPVQVTDLVEVSKDEASRFFVSDVISGGLLGHLGPLHLALGPNC